MVELENIVQYEAEKGCIYFNLDTSTIIKADSSIVNIIMLLKILKI